MSSSNARRAVWRRSSKCDNSSGNCVEVATLDEATAVRDSKDPASPVLVYTRQEWTAFIDGVKSGEFDE
jgi:predicted secreted Zn-dependent protease